MLLIFLQKVDYMAYLETFDHLFDIPAERKNTDYKAYLDGLIQYFCEYLNKIRPLLDLDKENDDVAKNFEKEWDIGMFPGWPVRLRRRRRHLDLSDFLLIFIRDCDLQKEMRENQPSDGGGEHLDLSPFNSWEELASLGLDRLKSALVALGLKCGG